MEPAETKPPLSAESVAHLLRHLSLPIASPPTLPSTPLHFLSTHLLSLPPSLLSILSPHVSPAERASIPLIRNRRLAFASSSPPPSSLTSAAAAHRNPLLWERLVGVLPPAYIEDEEEGDWATSLSKKLQTSALNGQQAGDFGALMRGLEEEKNGEWRRERKRAERKKEDAEGEEFDEESDEEEEEEDDDLKDARRELEGTLEERTEEFERVIRERWIAGVEEGVDYDIVDFSEEFDPLVDADEERWFEDESPGPDDRRMRDENEGEEMYDY